ncbi:hypothetical protein IH879_20430 [candidate division KSB1 bacterium]|nr:hypothetical protein [candidate division KSB1 bacterium]
MNTLFCLVAVIACFLFIGLTPGESEDEMIAATDTLDKQFIEAYNNKDADALMATYWNSPELVS